MREAIERHGGTVEKFIGDAVMAVFGVPVAHEDDALRAVRAAAEMRSALGALNVELERELRDRVALRTGVNTGEVVAGDPGAGETLVTGDPVNMPPASSRRRRRARSCSASRPSGCVRDAVTAEPVEPLELKGKSEPVPAYRLVDGGPRREPLRAAARCRRWWAGSASWTRCARPWPDVSAEGGCELVTLARPRRGRQVPPRGGVPRFGSTGRRGCSPALPPYGEGITYWPLAEALRAGRRRGGGR